MPEPVECPNAKEWFTRIAERRTAGHTLVSDDDVRRLVIGFKDTVTDEVFHIKLKWLKLLTDDDVEALTPFGLTLDAVRENIRMSEGRQHLYGPLS